MANSILGKKWRRGIFMVISASPHSAAMKNLLLLPASLLSIFTTAKSFGDPVIGSRLLNRLGLHVARMVVACWIYRLRQFLLFSSLDKEDKKAFDRDGYLLKENFLPDDLYEELMGQIREYEGNAREVKEGDTLTRRLLLSDKSSVSFPAYQELRRRPEYRKLLAYTSSRNESPSTFLELIVHGVANGSSDPQKDLHKDTFHPTMKAWLFLEDVNSENGPFHYIPGSHRLTWQRIKWEYHESIERSTRGGSSEKTKGGAFRPTDEDARTLDLAEPVAFAVKKNTLVIADTMGFHKRGSAVQGEQRLSLWINSRVNPFNPFPGFRNKYVEGFRDEVYEWYLGHLDKKAAGHNKTARAALVKFWGKRDRGAKVGNPHPSGKAQKSGVGAGETVL